MDKDDIINYVMETPGNSNPAVLGSMLNQYNSGSGSGDGELFFVHITDNGDDMYYSDKTIDEIYTAYRAGKIILASYYGVFLITYYVEDYTAIF